MTSVYDGPPLLSIVLPVRNERQHLPVLVRMLRAAVDVRYEVLAVHDDLDDDTVPVARELGERYGNVRPVHNLGDRGVADALRAGVEAARGRYVLTHGTDDVVPVLSIPEMLGLVERGCEFVSVTRYAHGGRRLSGSRIGGALSRLANWTFNRIVGSALTDSTTGMKMFRREDFAVLGITSKIGWSMAFELAIKAELAGLRLGEVPVISADRLYGGRSTFRIGPWFWAYLGLFMWGARQLRRRRAPVRVSVPDSTFASRYGARPR